MAMTYSSLQTQIANTLKRSDLTSRITEFIESAEFRIAREVRPRGFERYVSSTFTAGTGGAIIDQPVRLETMISFHVLADAAGTAVGNVRRQVWRRSYSFVRTYGRDQTVTGLPRFYADMGQDEMLVAPAPSAAFAFNLGYYERLAPLSGSNTTNWLTDNAPTLILYASLIEAAPFLMEDPRVPVWEKMYRDAATGVGATTIAFDAGDAETPRKTA